jgi:PTS system nitrogen regulatory IIA component
MPGIWQYLHRDLILFCAPSSREEILDSLIDRAIDHGLVEEGEKFRTAIEKREELVSTGVGMGVSLPHAKSETCPDFFIAVGILKKGIEWDSLDKQPVRLVFLIGGPDDRPTDYLQLLSELTVLLKDENCRKTLLKAERPDEVLQIFESL